jgi:hypothetical protein
MTPQDSQESTLTAFNLTEATLAQLETDHAQIPDATTSEGYALCKQKLAILRPLRTGVNKKRLELNTDDQDRIKHRNTVAKAIILRLTTLEDPIKAAKDTVDQEQQRIEDEKRQAEIDRIQAIQEHLKDIIRICPASSIEALQEQISKLSAFEVTQFEEYSDQALAAVSGKVTELNNAKTNLLALEQQRQEQQRIAEQQTAQQAEIDKQATEIKAQQDAIVQQQREQEQATLDAERAEADTIRLEKQRLEQLEADRIAEQQRIEAQQAEQDRINRLKPDVEIINDWCAMLLTLEAPVIDDKDYQILVVDRLQIIHNMAQSLKNSVLLQAVS